MGRGTRQIGRRPRGSSPSDVDGPRATDSSWTIPGPPGQDRAGLPSRIGWICANAPVAGWLLDPQLLPDFNEDGLLPPGEYATTFDQLRASALVAEPPGRASWDRPWRSFLVDNLELLTWQLWRVGIVEVYAAGSFVEAKDHPADIDGYFACDRAAYKSRRLRNALNALDPYRAWTWRQADRRPDAAGKLKLPLWHHYRVELFPYYGQPTTEFRDRNGRDLTFPELFRRRTPAGADAQDPLPKGIVKLAHPSWACP